MTHYVERLSRVLNAQALGQPLDVLKEAGKDIEPDDREHSENVGGHIYSIRKPRDSHIKVPLPSAHQSEKDSCGAAALRSIFQYFGVWKPFEHDDTSYRHDLMTDPDEGTPPDAIKRVATAAGMQVVEMHDMTTDDLKTFLDQGKPVICCVQAWGEPENYDRRPATDGHYVVAIGYDDQDNIYFMDPSITRNRGYLNVRDFTERWYDEESDGTPYYRYGMAIWRPDGSNQPFDTSTIRKAKEIE